VKRGALVLAILWINFLISACSDEKISREDEVRQYIESGVAAAEDRSSGDIAKLIDASYFDERNFTKTQLTKLIRLYFFRVKNIHLFTKIDRIEFIAENEVLVTLHVAMAGSVISDPSLLSSIRARFYKFELELVKQDEWLLQRARWQSASMGDMQ